MLRDIIGPRGRARSLGLLTLAAACSGGTEPGETFTHPAADRVTSLPLGGRPHGVAVARNGTFYVSQIDAASATRGTLSPAEQFSGAATVGSLPAHVAVDPSGTTAYTTNQGSSDVSVIDVATNRTVASIPLSDDGFNLIVAPDGRRVYATTASGTLHVIDAASRRVLHTLAVGPAANGLALATSTKLLYVSSRDAATVTAIDVATNRVVRTYPVSASPQRLAANAAGSAVYVASESVGLEVLDPATGTRRRVMDVNPGAVGLALSPDGVQLYVANPPRGQVQIVDVASGTVVHTLTAALSPRNVAFDRGGTTALITDERGAVVFVR